MRHSALGDAGTAAKDGLPHSSSDSGRNRLRAASSPAARSPGFTELTRHDPVLRGHASLDVVLGVTCPEMPQPRNSPMPPPLWFPLGISSTDLANPLTLPENAEPWILGSIAEIVFVDSGLLFPLYHRGFLGVHRRYGPRTAGNTPFLLISIIVGAALLGDQVEYWIGHRYGTAMSREDSRLLKLRCLRKDEQFFQDKRGIRSWPVPRMRRYGGRRQLPRSRFPDPRRTRPCHSMKPQGLRATW